MPFPAKDPSKPRPVWGKTKSRKYAVWYCSRKKDSANPENWVVGEFRGISAGGVHNAVVRHLRGTLDRPELKKSDVLIMEAHVLPLRTSLDQYLVDIGAVEPEEAEEE